MKGKGKRVSFVIASDEIDTGSRRFPKPRTVRGDVQVFWMQPGVIPEIGDTVRLYGELKSPRRRLNPGEFDQEKYLQERNIQAVFQVIGKRSGHIVKTASILDPAPWIGRLRFWIAERVDLVYKRPESSILKALILGIRDDIGGRRRDDFMKTGTVHLFATANTKRDFAPFSNKIIAAYSP